MNIVQKHDHPWDDLFFQLEQATLETQANILQTFNRSTRGTRLILDSLQIPVGVTPKEIVWQLNKATLYHYIPILPHNQRHPVPLLLVYALINKPFIFDLAPGRSFIEYLLEKGFDVYLLDWGAPGIEDQKITFEEYVTDYLFRAVRKLLRVSQAREFSMLGYCIGATLATLYAALFPQAPLRNLILLTAPIDFTGSPTGSMAMWAAEGNLDVDKLVDTLGNIPGELIRDWAKMLKPVENFIGSYVNLLKIMDNENAAHGWQTINRWVEDVIPFSGEAFRQFVKVYLRGNALVTGKHVIQGRLVDLSQIKVPLLNVIAEYDHLVSRSQSETILQLVSSQDKTNKLIPSTHVGIMASARAREKLWPEITDWLSQRSDYIPQSIVYPQITNPKSA